MKKNLLALSGAVCLMTACQPSSTFKVSGTLSGVESDTLIVVSAPVSDPADRQMDTIPMQDGKFEFNLADSVLRQVNILAMPSSKPNADGSMPAMSMGAVSFLLLPGEPVTIDGSFDDYTVNGGEFYKDYNAVKESCKEYSDKIDSLVQAGRELPEGMAEDSIRAFYAPIEEWHKAILQAQGEYVKQNPDKNVSVYLLAQLPFEEASGLLETIGDQVKNGVMAPLYQSVKERCEELQARAKAEELVKEGAVAPQFTLKDLDGNDFSLASLKGKYVVLDFWGSWCGWCIKGIPSMKESYAKHKGKLEIVGIACNDTEEKWRAAVAEHELPWINVLNGKDPNVSTMYAVAGFPTKYIIDPEGNILKKFVGEDPAFYTFLDENIK